ncbi:MAG TPA: TIGR03087 family PEP-CTERM/XrtA system glycosyltransferase [Rubrivivax sp.]|nr:TIGR03087 family PEP-CTERM/XrtA system glycosyltransferase [Rubrivivax sp.]
MANLLYLVHRMPYPPNKGDKLRSYHLLRHLAARHRVFVGTFVDDPGDEAHVETLRGLCAGLHVERLHPRRARLASLAGLASGDALTLHYYRSAALRRWVAQTVQREDIAAAVVFSSSMAQYAQAHPQLPMLVDFVDVDSAKWADYAPRHRWPLSWLYRREGRRLLAAERVIAARAQRSFFATAKEAALFRELAPECAARVEAMDNGVDTVYYDPDVARASPFADGEIPLVFTGAMDYWPNIDAVSWFATEVLPRLREQRPQLRFHIVGRAPTPAVRALAADPAAGVVVSGTVPDVRPYLQHAAVVVAPLRLARGVQNKVLEAMAMGRPVVAATACVEALNAEPGGEILDAADADEYLRCIDLLLRAPDRARAIGTAGRVRVEHSYTWDAHMTVIDRHLGALRAEPAAATAVRGLNHGPVA